MNRRCRFSLVCVMSLAPAGFGIGLGGAVYGQDLGTQEQAELGIDPLVFAIPEGKPLAGMELETATHSLAKVMRCPVCQGLSIEDSRTPAAVAMKEEVRDLLSQGYSPDQVLDYFEASYGEFVRLEPKAVGFNRLVWIAPLGALLLGALAIVWRLRSADPGLYLDQVDQADQADQTGPEPVDDGSPADEASLESQASQESREGRGNE